MFRNCVILCALMSGMLLSNGSGKRAYAADNSYVCVQWPIMDFFGEMFYYAEFYQSTCDDMPEVTYFMGESDWPQNCPDCETEDQSDLASTRFPGLDAPINPEYVIQLPEGTARKYSNANEIEGFQFVSFSDPNGELITAKVFSFTIYRHKLRGDDKDAGKTVYVALEIDGAPTAEPITIDCQPIDTKEKCFAYRATHRTEDGEDHRLLVLTAK